MFPTRNYRRNCISFLLCLLLLLPALVSCKKEENPSSERIPHKATGVWDVGEPFAFPDDCTPVYCNFAYRDGQIYSKVYEGYTDVKLGVTDAETGVCSVTDFPGISNVWNEDGYIDVSAFALLSDGGFAVVYEVNSVYVLTVTDENGTVRSETTLDDLKSSTDHLLGILYSPKNDTLYPYSMKYIAAVKPDGTYLYRVSVPYLRGCGVSRDGIAYAVYQPSSGTEDVAAPSVAPLDDTLKSFGAEYPLPENMNLWNGKIHSHPDHDLCYTTNESDGVYVYDFPKDGKTAEQPRKILDFVNSDMEKPAEIFFCGDDLACILRYGRDRMRHEYVTAVRVAEEEIPEKYEIHIACTGIPPKLSGAARQFNRQSDTCRILFDSYEQYLSDTYEGLQDEYFAYTQLKNDILTGYRPDLIVGDAVFPLDALAAQGMFCDLYSYLDSDPEFGRDVLLGCVKEPFETEDGTLPYLVMEFGVNAVCTEKARAEQFDPWNLDHANALLDTLPEDSYLFYLLAGDGSPLSVLKKLLPFYERQAAENPEVLSALLTFCKNCRLPAGMNTSEREEAIRNGTIMAKEIPSFETYIYMRERYQTYRGAELSLIGFPSETGNAAIRPTTSLAITTDAAKNPVISEGAWEFVKMAVQYVPDDLYGSPFYNVSATKESLEQVFSYYDNYYFWYSEYGFQSSERKPNGVEEFLTLSEDEKQMLRDFYNGITVREGKDPKLTALICEDASAFFAGVKSLEETVTIITSRAGLYLAENSR